MRMSDERVACFSSLERLVRDQSTDKAGGTGSPCGRRGLLSTC